MKAQKHHLLRIVLAVAMTLSIMLAVVPNVLALEPPAGSINPHAWDPGDMKYENGNVTGYVEGQVAAIAYHLGGLPAGTEYNVWICLEAIANNGSYGFINFGSSWIQTHDPGYLPTANGQDSGVSTSATHTVGQSPTSLAQNGSPIEIWGYNLNVISVSDLEKGTTTQTQCPVDRYIGVNVVFQTDPTNQPADAWLAWGGYLSTPGDTLPPLSNVPPATDWPDSIVPAGQGASNVNGTFQTHLGPANDKTVNFAAPDTAPDLGIDKVCYTNLYTSPYFDITVTNLGDTTATNVLIEDTLQYGLTMSSFTSTPATGTCSAAADPIDPTREKVTCNLASLATGETWQVRINVNIDSTVFPPGDEVPVENTAVTSSDAGDVDLTNNTDLCSTSTPVTLAFFSASASGDGVHFEWSTATEVANVGFNLYTETEDGLTQVNELLIPSKVVDSMEPQDYSFDASGIEGQVFYLEDVDLNAVTRLHGPFAIGEGFGERVVVEKINWDSIRAEHMAKSGSGGALLAPPLLPNTGVIYFPKVFKPVSAGYNPVIDLQVSQDGLYRLTFEDLRDAGFNLYGASLDALALSNRGLGVPIYVHGEGAFTEGDYIEFYGQALDSLYTSNNVYRLQLDASRALRASQEFAQPAAGAQAAGFYMETVEVENDLAYNPAAPNGDPWVDTEMFVYKSPETWSFQIEVEDYLSGAAAPTLDVGMWGATNFPASPDHHVVVGFNGTPVADEIFDGTTNRPVSAALPAGLLQEGANTMQLTLAGDTGVSYDLVYMDKFSVTYPRAFLAVDGKLQFGSDASSFSVAGLPSADAVVYRLEAGSLVRLDGVEVGQSASGYSASFAGSGASATYLVYSQGAILTPAIQAARTSTDITSGSADYLMISHPDFIAGLAPLVQARQAQGYTVRVVDVFDVYGQFGHGIFAPDGIKNYISYASRMMGVQYILLVGGDTYDYFDYEGSGSMSFIPSFYAPTGSMVKFAPVDPLFADLNGDRVPDRALGRFPVRNSTELASIIQKTLAYDAKDYSGSAVFAADAADGGKSFKADSELFVADLNSWNIVKAYIDDVGITAARTALIDALNSGVSLASFVGHSSMTQWTFQGLFSASDAAALTNAGKPAVVTQWGCWNTYYVVPSYNSMGHTFLLSGDRGAAAVMGASTLTDAASEAMFGKLLTPQLVQPGMTIGQAMLQAKQSLGSQYFLADVLLGWTLLGDPTLVIQQ